MISKRMPVHCYVIVSNTRLNCLKFSYFHMDREEHDHKRN